MTKSSVVTSSAVKASKPVDKPKKLPLQSNPNDDDSSFKLHCSIALVVRLFFVVYGAYHDRYFKVPYTDVDYKVFTDAAR